MNEIKHLKETIDKKIVSILQENYTLNRDFLETFQYILNLKGKRIRSVLMILSYKLYKDDIPTVFNQAMAVELFHSFTLVHDDIMDNSERRRGKVTVNKMWGNNIAILMGDVLLTQAYKYLTKCPHQYISCIMPLFTEMSTKVCEGQFLDLKSEYEMLTVEQYMHLVKGKTAELLAFCMKIGAVLGDASINDQNTLYKIGLYLGIAFQLEDDLLDIYGNQTICGKDIQNDIFNRKKTFLLIQAIKHSNEQQRNFIYKYLNANIVTNSLATQIKSIYDDLDILRLCKIEISSYYDQIDYCLKILSVEDVKKDTLRKFISYIRDRKN